LRCNSLCRFSFLISAFPAATLDIHQLRLNRDISSVDSAEEQAVLAPITQLFDGMANATPQ